MSMDFLVKSGRAVMFPIYRGTYERWSQPPAGMVALRDEFIKRAKDFRRSVDYLETRSDVDPNRLGYYGMSTFSGPVFFAIEPRLKVAILNACGCASRKVLPEMDPVNFAPRVQIPVLMLNGRYDFWMPLETCQEPIFRLLGAPAADKRHALFDSGHAVPLTPSFRETLNWLDHYLGPVN
jgi:pimeloyl-ACP methyl ester carboxylesterase